MYEIVKDKRKRSKEEIDRICLLLMELQKNEREIFKK